MSALLPKLGLVSARIFVRYVPQAHLGCMQEEILLAGIPAPAPD
jgi:hypothetical protein